MIKTKKRIKTRAEGASVVYKIYNFLLKEKSLLVVALKGQMLIEKETEDLLYNVLINANVFEIERMFLPQKIDLLIAIGTLTVEEGNPYYVFNKIRRKYAHDLDYDVSSKDINDLKNAFSPKHKMINDLLAGKIKLSKSKTFRLTILILLSFLMVLNCVDPINNKIAGDDLTIEDIKKYFKSVEKHKKRELISENSTPN